MTNIAQLESQLAAQKLVPLFYTGETDKALLAVNALYESGIRVFEFTHRGPEAMKVFQALVQQRDKAWPGMFLLIGTIFTAQQAEQYHLAGADGLVSPCYDAGVSQYTREKGVFWIPGCMTPTEIHQSAQSGCSWIKLFPGNTVGMGFLRSIKPVFPQLKFMVTGGVELDIENIRQWFQSGAHALGLGSNWISSDALATGDVQLIRDRSRRGIEILHQLKQQ